jgi:DNA primase catalytic core
VFIYSISRNSDIFNDIKRNVDILAVIRRYAGVELVQKGKDFRGLCPFHQEKTPSFTVNPEKGLFYCFGCGAGGDAVAFVSQLHGLKPIEAARLIAKDHGLASDVQPLSQEDRKRFREQQRIRERRKAFSDWCDQKYLDLCSLWRAIHEVKAIDWIDHIPDIERDLNILQYGSDNAKLRLFQGREGRPWLL